MCTQIQKIRSDDRRKPPIRGKLIGTKAQQRQCTDLPHHRDQVPISGKTGVARHTHQGGIPKNEGDRTILGQCAESQPRSQVPTKHR